MYILRDFRVRPYEPPWAGECETWEKLDLENEFIKLIIDLQLENKLLEHLLHCKTCKANIQKLVEQNE